MKKNLLKNDYGRQALVEYDPQESFCHFICFYMPKKAIGLIVRTINIQNCNRTVILPDGSPLVWQNYDFAVTLSEGDIFLVQDQKELTENDYGKQALIEYDPQQDQFCHFICFYMSL